MIYSEGPDNHHLSPQEQEVFRSVANGCSLSDISRGLGIEVGSVSDCVAAIRVKLRADERAILLTLKLISEIPSAPGVRARAVA